eukprot:m.173248 g.173248  ORF g.173248 m.173248 type:complete len:116 (-) comp24312_c1_seq1:4847-5194(-)
MAGMGGSANYQPRVNGAMVPDHMGKRVTLVGKVIDQTDAAAVKVTASDGHEVIVNFDESSVKPDQLGAFIEVVATVDGPTAVSAMIAVNLDDKFNMDTYNQAVELMAKHPEAFTK